MTPLPIGIVGGGPVGMTAALLLARYGVASVILEAATQRDPVGSKALCMQRDVLDVLERIGCGKAMAGEGVTWTVGRTYYREHELFQITFPEIGDNAFPPFVNIGQDRTERLLEGKIDDSDLTTIQYGHTVTGYEQYSDHVTAAFDGPDGPGSIDFDYLVGADGARSVTRKIMGVAFDGRSFDDKFLICDIRADLPFANERRFFFDPEWNADRQVLIHPQAGSVWRIDWQVAPDFDLEADEESGGLEARIRKIIGERDYEIVWMSVYRFHQRLASTFRDGRVFLAGDAAHLMSVFGARGLNSGVQDAENLAWKLAFVRNRWAGDELLDTYTSERRAAAQENIEITGTTMDFLVPPTDHLWEKRRSTLAAAVGNPNARYMVDSGQLATPFVYRNSTLTTHAPGRSALEPGMLFPDGPVDAPNASRMRELFGGPIVVVGNTPIDLEPIPSPVDVLNLDDIDTTGILADALDLEGGTAVVIRPDGHIAAIVPAAPQDVLAAVRRAVGETTSSH